MGAEQEKETADLWQIEDDAPLDLLECAMSKNVTNVLALRLSIDHLPRQLFGCREDTTCQRL